MCSLEDLTQSDETIINLRTVFPDLIGDDIDACSIHACSMHDFALSDVHADSILTAVLTHA